MFLVRGELYLTSLLFFLPLSCSNKDNPGLDSAWKPANSIINTLPLFAKPFQSCNLIAGPFRGTIFPSFLREEENREKNNFFNAKIISLLICFVYSIIFPQFNSEKVDLRNSIYKLSNYNFVQIFHTDFTEKSTTFVRASQKGVQFWFREII